MCVRGELGKQENLFLKMRISKDGEGMLYYFPQGVAMVLHHLQLLKNPMLKLGLKLVGYGVVGKMMEREGGLQATMEA